MADVRLRRSASITKLQALARGRQERNTNKKEGGWFWKRISRSNTKSKLKIDVTTDPVPRSLPPSGAGAPRTSLMSPTSKLVSMGLMDAPAGEPESEGPAAAARHASRRASTGNRATSPRKAETKRLSRHATADSPRSLRAEEKKKAAQGVCDASPYASPGKMGRCKRCGQEVARDMESIERHLNECPGRSGGIGSSMSGASPGSPSQLPTVSSSPDHGPTSSSPKEKKRPGPKLYRLRRASTELADVCGAIAAAAPELFQDEVRLLQTHQECFVGEEAVAWMQREAISGVADEAAAKAIGSALLAAGLIAHVFGRPYFAFGEDGEDGGRCVTEQLALQLNSRRGRYRLTAAGRAAAEAFKERRRAVRKETAERRATRQQAAAAEAEAARKRRVEEERRRSRERRLRLKVGAHAASVWLRTPPAERAAKAAVRRRVDLLADGLRGRRGWVQALSDGRGACQDIAGFVHSLLGTDRGAAPEAGRLHLVDPDAFAALLRPAVQAAQDTLVDGGRREAWAKRLFAELRRVQIVLHRWGEKVAALHTAGDAAGATLFEREIATLKMSLFDMAGPAVHERAAAGRVACGIPILGCLSTADSTASPRPSARRRGNRAYAQTSHALGRSELTRNGRRLRHYNSSGEMGRMLFQRAASGPPGSGGARGAAAARTRPQRGTHADRLFGPGGSAVPMPVEWVQEIGDGGGTGGRSLSSGEHRGRPPIRHTRGRSGSMPGNGSNPGRQSRRRQERQDSGGGAAADVLGAYLVHRPSVAQIFLSDDDAA